MTTDKTPATLATVKHGGCVQLASSERARFEAWLATQHDQGSEHVIAMVSDTDDRYQSPVTSSMWSAWQAANAAREGGRINGWRMYDGIRVYSASAHASIVDDQQFVRYDNYLAALSAQPSPGGQDADMRALADSIGEVAHRLSTYMPNLSEWADRARDCKKAADVLSALAARQPVGEPVLWVSPDVLDAMAIHRAQDFPAGGMGLACPAGSATVPLYLGSPAQAVDLPYSLDADPAGIRARVADVITGTLMVAAQGHTPPPAGHWAQPFWQAARHDAARSLNVTLRLRELVAASTYMRDRVVETRGVKCMDDLDHAIDEAQKALIDSLAVGNG